MTPAKLVASLPSSIRVGAYDFAIIPVSVNEGTTGNMYGMFASAEQSIRIVNDFSTVDKAVDVFLHEVFHAVWWVNNIHDADQEERTVSALGTAWMGVFKDNPWLLKWLAKALA